MGILPYIYAAAAEAALGSELQETVARPEKHHKDIVGRIRLHPNQKLFLVNPETLECKEARVDVSLSPATARKVAGTITGDIKKAAGIPAGWVAVPAINKANAVRKIRKLIDRT